MKSSHDEQDLDLVVESGVAGADGVAILTLVRADGGDLPAWAPGAHIDLISPTGVTRQFSLAGDPQDRGRWVIGVLREQPGRGGSEWVHSQVHPGDPVSVRGPRNHFALEPSPAYIFIAGGIGITPIRAMVRQAERDAADWKLFYGGRTRATMAWREELAELGDRVRFVPQDEDGLLDVAGILTEPRPDTLVYACGPEGLLQAVEAACESASWPEHALHLERFAPKEVGAPVLTDSFEVELVDSGMTLTVPPDKSILQVCEEAGVNVVFSCREGMCGTCETAIVEGEADHRDSLLTEEEQEANETMMICVSRAACPKLVLQR